MMDLGKDSMDWTVKYWPALGMIAFLSVYCSYKVEINCIDRDSVAQGIVDQVVKGESGQVILPGAYKMLLVHMRSLPDWMQYPMRAGLAGLMTSWNGRQVTVDEK